MGAFVYMLLCSDGSYYVGSARGDSLDRRVGEHQSGLIPGYTARRLPARLVWSDHFDQITDAIAVERQIKGWSRAKKEALIRGDWPTIRGSRAAQGAAEMEVRPSRRGPSDGSSG